MNAIERFEALGEAFERDVQRLVDAYALRTTLAVRAQLKEWSVRFPRHRFTAWEAHGLLSFEVSPPVNKETAVEYLSGHPLLDALAKEAEAFQAVWNTQHTISLYGDTSLFSID